jgi:hypothetical protein
MSAIVPSNFQRRYGQCIDAWKRNEDVCRGPKALSVAPDHRAHGLIGTEILRAIDIEERGKF